MEVQNSETESKRDTQMLTFLTWEDRELRENKPVLCVQCVQRGKEGTLRNLSRFLSRFSWMEAGTSVP